MIHWQPPVTHNTIHRLSGNDVGFRYVNSQKDENKR